MKSAQLPDIYRPRLVTVTQIPEADIEAAESQLLMTAQANADGCWGYFPALNGHTGIDNSLRNPRRLATNTPTLTLAGLRLNFNFLRLSVKKQEARAPFHLDTDAATAVTGDVETLGEREVWRLLLNLSSRHLRSVAYLDVDSRTVSLDAVGTTVRYLGSTDGLEQTVLLEPRTTSEVQGLLFCANAVLHSGRDDENGHFVGGYGCELTPASAQ